MKNKLLLFFNNLTFRRKMTTICIFISLIPMFLFGILGYAQIRNQILKREESSLNETLLQAASSIDYKLNTYMNALNMILWNNAIKTSLTKTYETNYDLYLFYRENIDSLFLAIRSLNTDINTISLYTDADLYPHIPNVIPLDSARDMPWYDQALASTASFYQISEDGQKLYLVCRMYYRYPAPTTVVCITVTVDDLFGFTQNLLQGNYGFMLIDDDRYPVYEFSSFSQNPPCDRISSNTLLSGEIPSTYAATQCRLNGDAWTAWLYRPMNELQTAYRHFQFIALSVTFLCIVTSYLVATFLSKIVAQPLEKLSADISLVEQGNYNITYEDCIRNDEIGQLQHSFSLMVSELNHLINEVLGAQIEQQKYELRILQSQINPHFLYNSLSLINVQAIMTGQTGISQMAQLLSTFYRTMLNKGRNMTTVKDELENTRAYITIQQIMHSYSFDVTYDVDERVMPFSVLNLIIQPLAENAVLHGLDHRQAPGKGMLTISCRLEDDHIIFKVIDNGCGMSEEKCRSVLTEDSRGYGVKNVHQRILLYYGDGYGLQYRSTPGVGTCATLRLSINQ